MCSRFVYDQDMSRAALAFWGFALSVSLLAGPAVRVAYADAVPPPPDECPEGSVPWTDHGGPRCELPAPTDCGPGYYGAVGGTCHLRRCNNDAECADVPCREVSGCQEYRALQWNGWYWAQAVPPRRDNFLAGPPSPPPDGPAPSEWVPLGICGQDGPCEEPAECRPLKLCYPSGVEPAAASASARPKPPMHPSSSAERPGGCGRGCAVSRTQLVGSALFFAGVMVVAFARRRQR